MPGVNRTNPMTRYQLAQSGWHVADQGSLGTALIMRLSDFMDASWVTQLLSQQGMICSLHIGSRDRGLVRIDYDSTWSEAHAHSNKTSGHSQLR